MEPHAAKISQEDCYDDSLIVGCPFMLLAWELTLKGVREFTAVKLQWFDELSTVVKLTTTIESVRWMKVCLLAWWKWSLMASIIAIYLYINICIFTICFFIWTLTSTRHLFYSCSYLYAADSFIAVSRKVGIVNKPS